MVMMIGAVVIIVIRIITETATATMESDIIETGIANGSGSGIGVGMTVDLRPGYTSGGQRAEATIPRATVMMETGGRSGGATIVGGRRAGVGIGSVTGMAIGNDRGDTSASVGQAGMAGVNEVLNIEEGMHDDIILAGCAY